MLSLHQTNTKGWWVIWWSAVKILNAWCRWHRVEKVLKIKSRIVNLCFKRWTKVGEMHVIVLIFRTIASPKLSPAESNDECLVQWSYGSTATNYDDAADALGKISIRNKASGVADAAAIRADENRSRGLKMEEWNENGCCFWPSQGNIRIIAS